MKSKFARACKAAGTTPTTLAKKLGLAGSSGRRWAKGDTPQPLHAKRVARELKTTVEELF